MIIAIDGPAGSGKSTTAKAVAHILGFKYLDTGAMYRAVTYKIIDSDVNVSDTEGIQSLLSCTDIEIALDNDELMVSLDGVDVTNGIRSREVNGLVSQVSEIPSVRDHLVPLQRKFAHCRDTVAEGRDIGTVVFPNADLKVFMLASESERAGRRLKELHKKGIEADLDEICSSIRMRDQIDSNREHSPLMKADDAVEVDTTNMGFDAQVNLIVSLFRDRCKESSVV